MKSLLLAALILPLIGTIAIQPEQESLFGPDTAILFTMDGCPPCERAKDIVVQMEHEGYDIKITKSRSLAKSFNVYSFPTLIIRRNGKETLRKIGLLSDLEYRSLVPFKRVKDGITF